MDWFIRPFFCLYEKINWKKLPKKLKKFGKNWKSFFLWNFWINWQPLVTIPVIIFCVLYCDPGKVLCTKNSEFTASRKNKKKTYALFIITDYRNDIFGLFFILFSRKLKKKRFSIRGQKYCNSCNCFSGTVNFNSNF